ncbi:MAG: hypothetical protein AAGK04_09250, partial [Planctomycetota bacterium]
IYPALEIADADGGELAAATLTISGWLSDQDVFGLDTLLAGDLGLAIGISVNADVMTVTLTPIEGDAASIDAYQQLIRTFTYVNTSEDPSDAPRLASLVVNDGELDSNPADRTIDVVPENDAPGIDLLSERGTDRLYVEDAEPLLIFPTSTVTDPDSDRLQSLTITIIGGLEDGDTLAFSMPTGPGVPADVINISGMYDEMTGALSLTGLASLDAYTAVLRTVTFSNPRQDLDESIIDRNLEIILVDEEGRPNDVPINLVLAVQGVNDAPTLSPETGDDIDFDENDGPIIIAPDLDITDPDDDTLLSAMVTIVGYVPGEDTLTFGDIPDGLMVEFDADTGMLIITGPASIEDFEAFLRTVGYQNTSDDPSDDLRTIEFKVTDEAGEDSNILERDLSVIPDNDPPTGNPNGADLVYTEDDPATPIAPMFEVTDLDSDTLVGAEIRISDNYLMDQDVLGFADIGNITGSFDADTGVLTLTGVASLAEYQDAIRSVTYLNSSQDPSDALRAVEFRLDDGEGFGPAAMGTIEVIPENDAPGIDLLLDPVVQVTVQGPAVPAGEQAMFVVPVAPGLVVSDPDDNTLVGAEVRIDPGTIQPGDALAFTSFGGITGSYNATTGVLTLSGEASLEDYQSTLRSVSLTSTSLSVISENQTLANERGFEFVVFDRNEGEGNDQVQYAITAESGNRAPTLTMVDTFPGASGQANTITYDELLAASDAEDLDGDTIFFRIESIKAGALVSGGIELLAGALIGPGDTLTFIAPDTVGMIEAFCIVAFDGELVSGTPVSVAFDLTEQVGEIQPLTPGSSVGEIDGTENVAVANSFGEVLLFQDPDKSGEWTVVNLTESRGFPEVIGNVFTYVDTKDNATYAVGVALEEDNNGLLLFRQLEDGSWTMRDLSAELGVDQIRGGTIAAVEGPDGLVRISALSKDDNALLLFTQTGEADDNGDFQYEFTNLFDDQLIPNSEELPDFEGQMISWVATWGSIHIAGVDTDGVIWGVWTAPAFEGRWQADNLSDIADTPALAGAITVLITPWQTFHITGVDTDGDLVATWWAPSFGGDWRLDNLTDLFGGPEVASGSLQAYVTDWGGLNYAAISEEGEAVVYWWSAQAGTWTPTFVRDLAPEGSNIRLESITGISGPFLTISLFGVGIDEDTDEGRELYAWFWEAETNLWTPVSLTDTATSLDATGGPLDGFAGDSL